MNTPAPQAALDTLCAHSRQTALLTSIEEILCWDERTQMPPAAGTYRAEQNAFLAGEIHKRQTDPRVGEWLAILSESQLDADPHSDSGATIVWLRRSYEKKNQTATDACRGDRPNGFASRASLGDGP